jgi:enoyl-CoA hydratase
MLSVEVNGGVMVATLSRPPVNALNEILIEHLEDVLDEVVANKSVCVLHIRSDQKAFSAGADLALMQSCFATPEGLEAMIAIVRRMQALFARIESAPVVTLAEIGGAAVGGGLELALACDLRVAAAEAKFGLTEARLGLLPGAGGTQRLTRLCGRGLANRLILGGEVITGAEALELGIVQWACPRSQLIDRARELAAHYASTPRVTVALIKKCLGAADDRGLDGYENEITGTRQLYGNPETRRRVADFLNKTAA